MAIIINSKRYDDYILVSLKLDFEEAKVFNNMVGNVSLIPHELVKTESAIYERGKNGATKYFLIPKSLRKDTKLTKFVSCLKVDTKDKIIWTYFMDKFK